MIATALAAPGSSTNTSSNMASVNPSLTFQPPAPSTTSTYKHCICTLVEQHPLYSDQQMVTELPLFTSHSSDGFPFNIPHYTRIHSPVTSFPSVNFLVLVNTLMNQFGSQYGVSRPAPNRNQNYFNFWSQIPLTHRLVTNNLTVLRSLWWVLIYSNYIPSSQPLHNLYVTLKNELLSSLPSPMLPLNLHKILETIAQKTHSNWTCTKSFIYQLIMDRLIVGETGRFPSWKLPDWYGK